MEDDENISRCDDNDVFSWVMFVAMITKQERHVDEDENFIMLN